MAIAGCDVVSERRWAYVLSPGREVGATGTGANVGTGGTGTFTLNTIICAGPCGLNSDQSPPPDPNSRLRPPLGESALPPIAARQKAGREDSGRVNLMSEEAVR